MYIYVGKTGSYAIQHAIYSHPRNTGYYAASSHIKITTFLDQEISKQFLYVVRNDKNYFTWLETIKIKFFCCQFTQLKKTEQR